MTCAAPGRRFSERSEAGSLPLKRIHGNAGGPGFPAECGIQSRQLHPMSSGEYDQMSIGDIAAKSDRGESISGDIIRQKTMRRKLEERLEGRERIRE